MECVRVKKIETRIFCLACCIFHLFFHKGEKSIQNKIFEN